jgi:hypothetical protein
VIIRNLFKDQPISAIDTVEQARQHLSRLPLDVQPNYIKSLVKMGSTLTPQRRTLSEYLDLVEADPDTEQFCVEFETPEEVRELFRLPALCKLRDEKDLVSHMFVANPKNYAHLHYDRDQRDVLMYQVFGVKRYVLIHPRETRKLVPFIDSNIQRTSSIFLENFSERDKETFLRFANAYDCLLFPGETLLMPMMAWHYVEYMQTSMSINFRLGRNKYNKFLAESLPTSSVFVQGIAIKLMDENEAQCKYEDMFARLVDACAIAYQSERHRKRCVDRLCMEIYDELYPELRLPYTMADVRQRKVTTSQTHTREDPGTEVGESAVEPEPVWLDSDQPELAIGVTILSSISPTGSAKRLYIARNNRLEAELSPDPEAPWFVDFLECLTREKGLSVRALAEACNAEPSALRQVLADFQVRRWIVCHGKEVQ